jgi:hypothetical protein
MYKSQACSARDFFVAGQLLGHLGQMAKSLNVNMKQVILLMGGF